MPVPLPQFSRSTSRPSRRAVLGAGLGLGVGAALIGAGRANGAGEDRRIRVRRWLGPAIVFAPAGSTAYADPYAVNRAAVTYQTQAWTSPVITPGMAFTQLIPSWTIATPGRSWVQVLVRVAGAGQWSPWLVMARWCDNDPAGGGAIHRTSVAGQRTATVRVDTDTVTALSGASFTDYQVQVLAHRLDAAQPWPLVRTLDVMVSALPAGPVLTSPAGPAVGHRLSVPPLAQAVHRGHYAQWGGGGAAWCSPTSMAMILGYWRSGPSATALGWVSPPVDGIVDYSARAVYDYGYGGTGNWSFNVAYAARLGLRGSLTRLRSMTEAEAFLVAGIPLVASVRFSSTELAGAGYSTDGHLLVISGCDTNGDVICHDPAAHTLADNSAVRVTYQRGQFENVWLPRSGGLVYVVHPPTWPTPHPPAEQNWFGPKTEYGFLPPPPPAG